MTDGLPSKAVHLDEETDLKSVRRTLVAAIDALDKVGYHVAAARVSEALDAMDEQDEN